jgi:hypothetical protein
VRWCSVRCLKMANFNGAQSVEVCRDMASFVD